MSDTPTIRAQRHGPIIRQAVATAVTAAFEGRELRWGECDCAILAQAAAGPLGHDLDLARFGNYRNLRSAWRALKADGLENTDGILDAAGLPRIAPARALVADIIGLGVPGEMISLGVYLGGQKILLFEPRLERCARFMPGPPVEGQIHIAWSLEART